MALHHFLLRFIVQLFTSVGTLRTVDTYYMLYIVHMLIFIYSLHNCVLLIVIDNKFLLLRIMQYLNFVYMIEILL